MSALLVGTGVFLAALSIRPRSAQIDRYVAARPPVPRRTPRRHSPGPALAGAVAGAVAGLAIDPGRVPALALLGAIAGMLIRRSIRSTVDTRRAQLLLQELPTVADTIALHILAGESVTTAIRRFVDASSGVASRELRSALDSDRPIDSALRSAAALASHPEASRLYDLLGHAHRTGGALADSLRALAADYRAARIRELTAEGGRRALAAYGPILALMIPVTLLFLMYPTLAGLDALASPP